MNHYSSSHFLVTCVSFEAACLRSLPYLRQYLWTHSQWYSRAVDFCHFLNLNTLLFAHFSYVPEAVFSHWSISQTADLCWRGRSWDWGGKRTLISPTDWWWKLKIGVEAVNGLQSMDWQWKGEGDMLDIHGSPMVWRSLWKSLILKACS